MRVIKQNEVNIVPEQLYTIPEEAGMFEVRGTRIKPYTQIPIPPMLEAERTRLNGLDKRPIGQTLLTNKKVFDKIAQTEKRREEWSYDNWWQRPTPRRKTLQELMEGYFRHKVDELEDARREAYVEQLGLPNEFSNIKDLSTEEAQQRINDAGRREVRDYEDSLNSYGSSGTDADNLDESGGSGGGGGTYLPPQLLERTPIRRGRLPPIPTTPRGFGRIPQREMDEQRRREREERIRFGEGGIGDLVGTQRTGRRQRRDRGRG